MKKQPPHIILSLHGKLSIILLLTGIFFFLTTTAQQEWTHTQYLFNLYDVNGAYAGNHRAPSFSARFRSQWMGMEGAPITQQMSVHTPLFQAKAGAGLRFINESIGLREQQSVRLTGVYKMQLDKHTLSFGIAAGAIRNQFNYAEARVKDLDDAQMNNAYYMSTTPLVDAAVFINTNKFYAGVEANRLNRSSTSEATGGLSRLYYNMNLVAGYMLKGSAIYPSGDLTQLSTLIKFSEGNIYQAEFNLLFLKKNKYWFGGGYRHPNSMQVIACLNITPQWRFGLSYDHPLVAPAIQGNGSAEAYMGFNFKSGSDKSIRYF